jgi:hypothetical protein
MLFPHSNHSSLCLTVISSSRRGASSNERKSADLSISRVFRHRGGQRLPSTRQFFQVPQYLVRSHRSLLTPRGVQSRSFHDDGPDQTLAGTESIDYDWKPTPRDAFPLTFPLPSAAYLRFRATRRYQDGTESSKPPG